jgi:hypothetical protein
MKALRGLAGAAGLALTLGAAPALHADPPPRGPAPSSSARHGDPGERLKERRDRLRERHGGKPSGLPSSLPAPSASHAAWLPELSRRWAEFAATRQVRREKHRAALTQELGARLQNPRVRAELALHSQRVAELHRAEFLAKNARSGAEREQLLARIEKLRARETARHQRSLARLAVPAGNAAPAPSGSAEVER